MLIGNRETQFIYRLIDFGFLSTMISIARKIGCRRIAFFRYPEVEEADDPQIWDELRPHYEGTAELEPGTYYEDADEAQPVEYYRLNEETMQVVHRNYDTLVQILDSAALYRDDDRQWVMHFTFHEVQTTLRLSEDELKLLGTAGIEYGTEVLHCYELPEGTPSPINMYTTRHEERVGVMTYVLDFLAWIGAKVSAIFRGKSCY